MTVDADYQRTRYEANLDLDYKIRLYYLHERLYTRIHKNLRLLQLVGGSAAFASALGKKYRFHGRIWRATGYCCVHKFNF